MCTTVYAKVWLNGNTHGEAMSDVFVRLEYPLSPTLSRLYIDELEHIWTILTGVLHVYSTRWVPFSFMLTMLSCSLNQEQAYKDLWTSYVGFPLSFSLEIDLSKTKIMIFDRNIKKLNQKAFYPDKDQIEISLEYKHLGIEIYSLD